MASARESVGLVQVDELGVLETPIALTNTFNVGAVAHAQIRAAIEANPQIGRDWPSGNPLVFECNDGCLNDMRVFDVDHNHYRAALDACSEDVVRGEVGAGRGMSCFDLKGGIGTASRVVRIGAHEYTDGRARAHEFRAPAATRHRWRSDRTQTSCGAEHA